MLPVLGRPTGCPCVRLYKIFNAGVFLRHCTKCSVFQSPIHTSFGDSDRIWRSQLCLERERTEKKKKHIHRHRLNELYRTWQGDNLHLVLPIPPVALVLFQGNTNSVIGNMNCKVFSLFYLTWSKPRRSVSDSFTLYHYQWINKATFKESIGGTNYFSSGEYGSSELLMRLSFRRGRFREVALGKFLRKDLRFIITHWTSLHFPRKATCSSARTTEQ